MIGIALGILYCENSLLGCIFRKLIAIQAVFKLRIRYQLLRCSCSNLQSYLLFSFFYRKMLIIKIEGFVFQTLVTRCCAPVAYSSCCCAIVVLQLGSSIQEGIHRTRFIGYRNYISACLGTVFPEIVSLFQQLSRFICKLHIGLCFNFLLFQFYCIEIWKTINAIHLN